MAMEFIHGQMEVSLKVIGIKIRFLDMEYTIGKTAEFIMVTGKKIICMVRVITNGQTAANTKADM